MDRTLAIIKPNATGHNWIGRIIAMIEEDGLKVVAAQMTTLTEDDAKGFYAEHYGKPFYADLIAFMTSGPVLIMVLEGQDAVQHYRDLMGNTDHTKAAPMTIRSLYGESVNFNSVHGSDSEKSARREIKFFFPRYRLDTFQENKRLRELNYKLGDQLATALGKPVCMGCGKPVSGLTVGPIVSVDDGCDCGGNK